MTTFADLADDAAGQSVQTSVLLRRLKVLAFRTGIPELETWVDLELAGYDTSKNLPPYRGPFTAVVLAHLSGPFGSGFRNAQLPARAFGDGAEDGALFNLVFLQSLAELESMNSSTQKGWEERWSADTVQLANQLIQAGRIALDRNYVILQAHKVIPPQSVVGVLDAVRSRVLNLALEFEKLVPQDPTSLRPADRTTASQIVQMQIFGGSHNFAIGSSDFEQYVHSVIPGDKNSLFGALAKLGVADSDLADLETALAEDGSGAPSDRPQPGSRVQAWCGKAALGGIHVAGSAAAQVTAGVIAEMVLHFFGA